MQSTRSVPGPIKIISKGLHPDETYMHTTFFEEQGVHLCLYILFKVSQLLGGANDFCLNSQSFYTNCNEAPKLIWQAWQAHLRGVENMISLKL